MHGYALNVMMDLSPFQLVTPCGIEQCHVTSMADLLRYDVEIESVRRKMTEVFGEVFGIEWTEWVTDLATMQQRWRVQNRSSGDKGVR
jgi:lipoyl(octanoyl) transferase